MDGIRAATPDDAEEVAAIYGHHVLHGTASYDLSPPPAEYLRAKIEAVSAAGWPFLVAERDGAVVGYAYATQFRDREAYRFTAEDSIYVHPDWMGQGIGGALLDALIEGCGAFGFRTIIAAIGGAEPGSIRLHSGRGFREVARLTPVRWKPGGRPARVQMRL